MEPIKTFEDFLQYHGDSDTFNGTLADGNQEAQSEGCFGITHRSMIESWAECLYNELRHDLDDAISDMIQNEIDDCLEWHIDNGSIDDEI